MREAFPQLSAGESESRSFGKQSAWVPLPSHADTLGTTIKIKSNFYLNLYVVLFIVCVCSKILPSLCPNGVFACEK